MVGEIRQEAFVTFGGGGDKGVRHFGGWVSVPRKMLQYYKGYSPLFGDDKIF